MPAAPSAKKKIPRALAVAMRHRPVRAAWADRAVALGWYGRVLHWTPLVKMAFFALISLLFLTAILEGLGIVQALEGMDRWGLVLLLLAPLVLWGAGEGFVRAVQKRTSRILAPATPGVGALVASLPKDMEIVNQMRRWVLASKDANLSAYEYALVAQVLIQSRVEPKPFCQLPPGARRPDLDEEFYATFPLAPRFLPQDKGGEDQRQMYAKNVMVLDCLLGHMAQARTTALAQRMDRELAPAALVQASPQNRL